MQIIYNIDQIDLKLYNWGIIITELIIKYRMLNVNITALANKINKFNK
jgi:hypothetical protein